MNKLSLSKFVPGDMKTLQLWNFAFTNHLKIVNLIVWNRKTTQTGHFHPAQRFYWWYFGMSDVQTLQVHKFYVFYELQYSLLRVLVLFREIACLYLFEVKFPIKCVELPFLNIWIQFDISFLLWFKSRVVPRNNVANLLQRKMFLQILYFIDILLRSLFLECEGHFGL